MADCISPKAMLEALGVEIAPTGKPVRWQLRMTGPGGNLEVEDLFLILGYEWNEP